MTKRVYTDEEIQQKYLGDIQKAIAKDIEGNKGLYGDEDYSWFGTIFNAGTYRWTSANAFEFEYPDHYALTRNELEMFEKTDLNWSFAMVDMKDGKLLVKVYLVDYYEGD